MGQMSMKTSILYNVGEVGPWGEGTLISSVFEELSFLCLGLGVCARMSPQMSALSKSQQPSQTPFPQSSNPSKATSRQTECRQISVTSGAILKMTFYLNMVCSLQCLGPGGAGALQPRILKCPTAFATWVD